MKGKKSKIVSERDIGVDVSFARASVSSICMFFFNFLQKVPLGVCVCVCVCVCVRARARVRARAYVCVCARVRVRECE